MSLSPLVEPTLLALKVATHQDRPQVLVDLVFKAVAAPCPVIEVAADDVVRVFDQGLEGANSFDPIRLRGSGSNLLIQSGQCWHIVPCKALTHVVVLLALLPELELVVARLHQSSLGRPQDVSGRHVSSHHVPPVLVAILPSFKQVPEPHQSFAPVECCSLLQLTKGNIGQCLGRVCLDQQVILDGVLKLEAIISPLTVALPQACSVLSLEQVFE